MSIHHILLAKEYLERASLDLRSYAPFSAGFAVSALHDAVEMILFASAAHIGAAPARDFDGSWSAVDAKLPEGAKLPYRAQMTALNKVRVSFKHYGTVPDVDEVARLRASAEAFLTDVCLSVFKIELGKLSEIDLLTQEPAKLDLVAASEALESGDLGRALQRCADALAAIRDRESPLHQTPITVQLNNVPTEVCKEIRVQVGNVREQVIRVREIAFGALFGLNVVDLRTLEAYVPLKEGTEYKYATPHPLPLLPKNVARCISVLTRYAISVERYWNAGQHSDWLPL